MQEVDGGQLPHSIGQFPVPKPQTHIYSGPGMRIQRKVANVEFGGQGGVGGGGGEAMEVGSEGEEREEDSDTELEEIPGHLPPLPKTKEEKGEGRVFLGMWCVLNRMPCCRNYQHALLY